MSRSENTLTDLPNPKISESEFLADQADRAKAAAMAALSSAKVALGNSVDPRPAMRNHPLFVLGSASLAGFVAALLAIPSKKEQELRRMERIHRAMNPEPPPPAASNGNAKTDGKPGSPPHQSIWTTLIHEVVQLIRPILLTAITTGIKAATNPPPPAATDPNINQSL